MWSHILPKTKQTIDLSCQEVVGHYTMCFTLYTWYNTRNLPCVLRCIDGIIREILRSRVEEVNPENTIVYLYLHLYFRPTVHISKYMIQQLYLIYMF